MRKSSLLLFGKPLLWLSGQQMLTQSSLHQTLISMKHDLLLKRSLTFFSSIKVLLILILTVASLQADAQSNCLSFAPAVAYPSGGIQPIAVATADFNGDHKADLVVTNLGSNKIGVLMNNGNSTFANAVTYGREVDAPDGMVSIATGDFNGDGKADVAVANVFFNTVGVLLNNGNGTFATEVHYNNGGDNPNYVATGDFNGDGKIDLTVANSGSNSVGVLLNNGNGTFANAVTYNSGGDNPFSVATADFNGDGKTDVVTTNSDSNSVGVLLNKGNGTFADAVIYSSGGDNPDYVATGDFNGDGKIDLTVANSGSNSVGVLLNNGNGTFANAITYDSGGDNAFFIATADFNGDDKADVAVTDISLDNVGALLNNGDGTFADAVTFYSGGSSPYSIATGDFNGDGKADVVTANGGSNSVGVLLNNTPVQLYYADVDNDGYGDLNSRRIACSKPTNYVTDSTDCDDKNSTIHPGATEIPDDNIDQDCDGQDLKSWYVDKDKDGYGDANSTPTTANTKPPDLVADHSDCDDNNKAINPATKWYKDADGDGYSDGTTATQCQQPTNYKLVTNLTAISGDCNDSDPMLNPATVWYKDADNDGYYTGTTIVQCTSPGIGYRYKGLVGGGDCDDTNPALNPATKWYKDADNDGYGSGTFVTQCTRPSSDYKLTSELTASSGDFNDSNPAVNPGVIEVCGNGIDDNCNGLVDEVGCSVCQNATNFSSTSITAISAVLNWVANANPQQWQLQYKTTATGSKWVDVFLTGNIRSVNLSPLKSNQSYNWHIRAKCNGRWTSYSNAVSFKTGGATITANTETALTAGEETATADLHVSVMPNPSSSCFTIELQCNAAKGKTLMLVSDVLGRTLEVRQLSVSQIFQLGNTYKPGVYFVRFVQGQQSRELRLIKRSN
jgi:hypothetical protein